MKTIICYSDKSCVTGKAIREKFDALRKRTDMKAKCDLFIRWGSTEEFTRTKYKLELNTLTAVKNAVDKLHMLSLLHAAGIPIPLYTNTIGIADCPPDAQGNYYIRSKSGEVRYGNDYGVNDLYVTSPVKFKRREYRVHVFNGKVLGIYEKVPMVAGAENRPKLFKSDTCNFVRCDLAVCRLNAENQATCIAAVKALGLLFGGVDVIRDKNGNIFICEVNSAPGLNNLNIDRWVEEITAYAKENNLPVG